MQKTEEKIFIYAVCNVGSEDLLKEEVRWRFPAWRFAYSRPGFITFKVPRRLRPSEVQSIIFAQEMGYTGPNCEAGEPFKERMIIPKKLMDLPEKAPSRAYLKAIQAIFGTEIPLQKDEVALELGSSPGGTSYALLEAGLFVIGVDPGAMSPLCLEHKKFHFIQKSLQEVNFEDLPPHIDWIWVDINLAPIAVIKEMKKIIDWKRESLKGVILTLKMTKKDLVKQIPRYLKILQSYGLEMVLCRQWPAHHREFMLTLKLL